MNFGKQLIGYKHNEIYDFCNTHFSGYQPKTEENNQEFN